MNILTSQLKLHHAKRIIHNSVPFATPTTYPISPDRPSLTSQGYDEIVELQLAAAYEALCLLSELDLSPKNASKLVSYAAAHPKDPTSPHTLYLSLVDRVTTNNSLGRTHHSTLSVLAPLVSSLDQEELRTTHFTTRSPSATLSDLAQYLLAWVGYAGEQYFGPERVEDPRALISPEVLLHLIHCAPSRGLSWLYDSEHREPHVFSRSVSAALSPEAIRQALLSSPRWIPGLTNLTETQVGWLLSTDSVLLDPESLAYLSLRHPKLVSAIVTRIAELSAIYLSGAAIFTLYHAYQARHSATGLVSNPLLSDAEITELLQVADTPLNIRFLEGTGLPQLPTPGCVPGVISNLLRRPHTLLSIYHSELLSPSPVPIPLPTKQYFCALVEHYPGLAWFVVRAQYQTLNTGLYHKTCYNQVMRILDALPGDPVLNRDLFDDWYRDTPPTITLRHFCKVITAYYNLTHTLRTASPTALI
jgi:hypothetical protein